MESSHAMTFIPSKTVKIINEELNEELEIDRTIGWLKGDQPGPTVVFFGGVHGNEPSGVFALRMVFEELAKKRHLLKGQFIGVGGNLWALEKKERFHIQDLNRMWTKARMEKIESDGFEPDPAHKDEIEQFEIFQFLQRLLKNTKPPFYFLDLHTTSSDSIPFLTVNDTLANRGFAVHFPVPIILGIEEYLEGPLLSYINELGYIALGFEAGQHEAQSSVVNHRAFIYLVLIHSGLLEKSQFPNYDTFCATLKAAAKGSRSIYEIRYRYEVQEKEEFDMQPNYANFQIIHKGDDLARSNQVRIESHRNGRIFMPLYQKQGNDGFFLIRKVPRFALALSAWLRKWNWDRLLPLLPGVKRHSTEPNALVVNRRIARFYAKDFFHLFGYRSKQLDRDHIIMRNRETHSRYKEYQEEF